MANSIKAALIIAVGLVIAAIIHGGIYQMQAPSTGDVLIVLRINRFTGHGEWSGLVGTGWRAIGEPVAALPKPKQAAAVLPDLTGSFVPSAPSPIPTPLEGRGDKGAKRLGRLFALVLAPMKKSGDAYRLLFDAPIEDWDVLNVYDSMGDCLKDLGGRNGNVRMKDADNPAATDDVQVMKCVPAKSR